MQSEDELIALLRELIESHGPNSRLLNRIGDDAAVWQPSRSHRSVITADALIEGRHFRRATTSLHDIGWRCMAANLSDLAAMGARPVLATVTLGVPADLRTEDVLDLYRGMLAVAAPHRCAIAGGDLTRANELQISIAAIGEVRASAVKSRGGARPGDVAAVTGPLGGSRAGLFAQAAAALEASLREAALQAHNRPQPRIAEGRWLAASSHVRAMMDISDGLSTDLTRMCAASGCGVLVSAQEVPVAKSAVAMAELRGEDPLDFALAGGEDFELLVALDARAFRYLAGRFRKHFGKQLYAVGRFCEGSAPRVRKGADEEPLSSTGYDHFRMDARPEGSV